MPLHHRFGYTAALFMATSTIACVLYGTRFCEIVYLQSSIATFPAAVCRYGVYNSQSAMKRQAVSLWFRRLRDYPTEAANLQHRL
jgi:hypothetical protein